MNADERQEVFNKVCKHLLKQMAQSRYQVGSSCLYRGPKGLKCAIGCLIADKYYRPQLERTLANERSVVDALRKSGVNVSGDSDKVFLTSLQRIHDEHYPIHWQFHLKYFAKQWNLKMPKTSRRKQPNRGLHANQG